MPTMGTVQPGTVDIDRAGPTTTTSGLNPNALCTGCDVVLISVCSLRSDHVGAYGDTRGLTPTIDKLSKDSFRFSNAYAGANFTLGSLSTILTGSFGSSTGVLNWGRGLPERHRTIPEILGLFGYRTGGFSVDAATGFRPDYGLDKGFQRMVVIDPPRDTPDGRHADEPMGPGGATAQPLASWLAEQPKDRPVFAMLHTRSAHFPFVVSKDGIDGDRTGVRKALWHEGSGHRDRPNDRAMPGKAGGQKRPGLVLVGELTIQKTVRSAGQAGVHVWRETYAESVARMDKDIKVVLDAVKKRGQKTVVVVLADHGETLDDNGELLHGAGFFQSVSHVPMIVHIPGQSADKDIEGLVSQADLLPTIAEIVGVPVPQGIDGISTLPLMTGSSQAIRSTTLVEGDPSWTGVGTLPGAVISPPWTLLRQHFQCVPGEKNARPPPPPGAPLGEPLVNTCLFNISDDPGQLTNLATRHPETVEQLQARWDGFRAARAGRSVPRDLRLDPSMVEMLQRTGYDFRSGAE
jgi:arylsulfatase A-like enzyme